MPANGQITSSHPQVPKSTSGVLPRRVVHARVALGVSGGAESLVLEAGDLWLLGGGGPDRDTQRDRRIPRAGRQGFSGLADDEGSR
jgi:hypothetical protein